MDAVAGRLDHYCSARFFTGPPRNHDLESVCGQAAGDLGEHLAGGGVDELQPVDLVAKEFDAHRVLLVGRVEFRLQCHLVLGQELRLPGPLQLLQALLDRLGDTVPDLPLAAGRALRRAGNVAVTWELSE